MSEIHVLDARGLSCPQPVMLTRQELKKLGKGRLEVLVDSGTARENVSRCATNAGWSLSITEEADGTSRITITK